MQKRVLGKSGIEVAPLAFGGNVFGWTVDQEKSFKLLDTFVAAGFNLVDTADVYSNWIPGNKGGESETIIGNWMKQRGNREKIVVATKVGAQMAPGKQGLSRAHIVSSVEDSLRRLQTDYIDLYQSHKDDESTQIDETLEAYSKLVKDGKVRAIGASNFSAARLKRSLDLSEKGGYPHYQTLQPLYNLYDREEFEKELEPLCLERNVSVISYYSLASGFLTGKYRTEADIAKSPRGQGVKAKYMNAKGSLILQALDQVSEKLKSTPARVALAWLIARPSVAAPIASATSVEQLNDLIEATRLKLDRDSIELLNRSSQ